jgi:hypothetical protein
MSKAVLGMIDELGGQVEARTDAGVRDKVLSGAEALTPKTGGAEIAQWAKAAVDRMDALLPLEVRIEIMESCGAHCAKTNSGILNGAVARRHKYADEEAFLAAEIRKPPAGTRLEREADSLIQIYTPQAFRRPMRCFCALVKDLPAGETMSQTYCHCSKAFVRTVWEAALGRPVQVELMESAVSGSRECRFRITPLSSGPGG